MAAAAAASNHAGAPQSESCVYATDIERVADAVPAAFAAATGVALVEVQRYLYRARYERDGVNLVLTVRLSRVQGGTHVEVSCAPPASPRQTALVMVAVFTLVPLIFWGLYALAKVFIAPAKADAADRQLELVHGLFTHLTDRLDGGPTHGYRGWRRRFGVEPSAPTAPMRISASSARPPDGVDAEEGDEAADTERAASRTSRA
jgi:hypothetical protein